VGMDPYVEVLDVRFVYEPLLSEPRTLIRIDVGRPPRGVDRGVTMTSIHPELWVGAPRQARPFHEAAFGAEVVHLVGEDDGIVAQLAVGDAMFWIAPASSMMKRLGPVAIDGATGRVLLVVEDPDGVQRRAVAAGHGDVTGRRRAQVAGGSDRRPVQPRVGDREATWVVAASSTGSEAT
jgi:hypothetical protein